MKSVLCAIAALMLTGCDKPDAAAAAASIVDEPDSGSAKRERALDPPAREWKLYKRGEQIDLSSIYRRGSLATFKTRSVPFEDGSFSMLEHVVDCETRNATVLYNYINLPSGQKTYKDRWEGNPEWFAWYETLEGERFPALDSETYEIVCR